MKRLFYDIDSRYFLTLDKTGIRVWSKSGYGKTEIRELSQYKTKKGYLCVKINNKHKLIHHLVAEASLGKRPDGLVVNHIDGNKLNNNPDNLEYITLAENTRHSYKTGLHVMSNDGTKSPKYIDGRCKDLNAYKLAWYYKNKEKISKKAKEKYLKKKHEKTIL